MLSREMYCTYTSGLTVEASSTVACKHGSYQITAENHIIDKEKAKVYEIWMNTACKALIVLVTLASLIVLLLCLILRPSVSLLVVTTTIVQLLGKIAKHYFNESH